MIPKGATHIGRGSKRYYRVSGLHAYRWSEITESWLRVGYSRDFDLEELSLEEVMEAYINSE